MDCGSVQISSAGDAHPASSCHISRGESRVLKVCFAHCASLPRIVSHSLLLGSRDGCPHRALVRWCIQVAAVSAVTMAL